VHAGADADAGPRGGDLLDHLQVDLVRLRAAAVLLGEGQAQQPRAPQQPVRLLGERAALLQLGRLRRELLGGEVAGEREQLLGLLGGQEPVDGGGHVAILGRRRVVAPAARAATGCGR
jgi:hypothetical protein